MSLINTYNAFKSRRINHFKKYRLKYTKNIENLDIRYFIAKNNIDGPKKFKFMLELYYPPAIMKSLIYNDNPLLKAMRNI